MSSLTEEILNFIHRTGRSPNRKLGQNFLIDANIPPKISDVANLSSSDIILEIGPGLGFLTQELLEKAKQVVAIEIDSHLCSELERRFSTVQNLALIHGDALKLDLHGLIQSCGINKVVANLPYNISGPILWRLLGYSPLQSLVLMVQEEVAARLSASPRSKAYGSLTVWSGLHTECQIELTLKPQQFFPAPKVNSSLVSLRTRSEIQPQFCVSDISLFRKIVKGCFHTRRKMLRNSVKASNVQIDMEVLDLALKEVSIDSNRRGETLSISEFVALTNAIHQQLYAT